MLNSPEKEHRVFLDSNVFIAAALSERGGSFYLLKQSRQNKIKIFSSGFVMRETAKTIKKKYPQKITEVCELLSSVPISFVKEPDIQEIQRVAELLDDFNDAPILAAGLKSKSRFLISLDKKHFFTPKIAKADLPLIVLAPKDFIQKYLE